VRADPRQMPVILDPGDYARWLREEDASQEELKAMLRPAPGELMESFPVGASVGNVKNNSASLIEPVEACLAEV
jgi:putative SOS response-associated peptidase YedK